MRYIMQAKFFSLKNDFVINDENGNGRFVIKGKLISVGDNLTILDMAGNEVAKIKGKVFSIRKKHELYRNGQLAGVLKQKLFSLFRKNFYIEMSDGSRLDIEGKFTDHSYTFVRQGSVVAEASKKWFSIRDSFGVDIREGEDDVLILAATVSIDLIVNREDRSKSSAFRV